MRAFLRRWWAFFTVPLSFVAGKFLPLWAIFALVGLVGVVAVVLMIRLNREIRQAERALKALQAGAPLEVVERLYQFKHREERQ